MKSGASPQGPSGALGRCTLQKIFTHLKTLSAKVNSFERRLNRSLNKATRSHVFCAKTGLLLFFLSSVHPVPFPAFYPVAAAFNQMV